MKIIRAYRMIPVLLAVWLVIGCFFSLTAAAAPSTERYGRSILQRIDTGGRLVAAYDALADGATKAQSAIPMPQGNKAITQEELEEVFNAFYSDYPECFWINGYAHSFDAEKNVVHSVNFQSGIRGVDLEKAKQDFNRRTAELTKGLAGKSDYEKAKTLHDRLAAAVEYVPSGNDQNAYGALVEGKAVCAGYTHGYQHLLQQVGIPAWTVHGVSVNPANGRQENHAWNAVKLDGQWYYTDVTWDDQGKDLFYAYFNLSSKQMGLDHAATQFAEYLPQATATSANYFVKNDAVFQSFDADKLANALKKGNMTARLYIEGDREGFRANFRNQSAMRKVIGKVGYSENAGFEWTEKILGREVILSVYLSGGSTTKNALATTTKGQTTTTKVKDTTKGKDTVATTVKGGKTTAKAPNKATATVAPDEAVDSTASTPQGSGGAPEEDTTVTDVQNDVPVENDTPIAEEVPEAGDAVSDTAPAEENKIPTVAIVVVAAVVAAGGVAGLLVWLRRRA